MKIFLDTGSLQEIESFVALGIVDGVIRFPQREVAPCSYSA